VLLLLAIFSMPQLFAQYTTITNNGSIGTNEYGDHSNGQNRQDNFYMTWDASNLYIGIISSNVNKAAVVYFDVNPIVPVNGGNNANGTLVGL
jgi:hypothetical protein